MHRPYTWPTTALVAAAVLVPMVAGTVWYLGGGRGEIVATPSMGTAAPVGTLVLTRPADDIRVGDVITYRPPNPLARHTTTHRVVAVDTGAADGPTYTARGDINGADDPWVITRRDVVGRAVALVWGLGWLIRAAPPLVAGGLVIWWVTRVWTSAYWRAPLRVLGSSLLLATVIAWLRPFVGVIALGTTADAGGSSISLVSTGMLPIRTTADTGGHLDLVDGQTGVLTTRLPEGAQGAVLTSGVHMAWWLWVLMTLLWLTPMICGLVSAVRHPPTDGPGSGPPPPPGGRPWVGDAVTEPIAMPRRAVPRRLVAGGVPHAGLGTSVLVFGAVLALTTSTTTARFTAAVTNAANTAASAPYFTCRGAATGLVGAGPYLVWPLADDNVPIATTAADVSGNARTGLYVNAFSSTTNAPCPRDTPVRAVTLAPTALTPSYVAMTGLLPVRSSNVFTVAIWFRTTTTTGGRLIGWGNNRILGSTTYDRHLYMTDAGKVVFGVYPGVTRTVVSPDAYNDGRWHLAVGTLSPAGMALYLDGAPVATDPTTTTAEGGTANTGFWRVGWDNLNPVWTSQPTTDHWTGSLAFAEVYTTALGAAQVRQLYTAGT